MDINKAISTAVKREEFSYKLYMHLYKTTDILSVKTLCRRLAKEELGHKKALLSLDAKKLELKQKTRVVIGRTLVSTPLTELGGVQAMLHFAIDKEQNAYEQYKKLEKVSAQKKVKQLFSRLAEQEANHKKLILSEYKRMF